MNPNREQTEHLLKYFFECEYSRRNVSIEEAATTYNLNISEAKEFISTIAASGLIDISGEYPILTPRGRDYAVQVVRAHRLYETYLARTTGLQAAEWHKQAHQKEHELSAEEIAKLASDLGNPRFDPHGDPIPTATGQVGGLVGMSLSNSQPGSIIVVLHIEDEPEDVYRELSEKGMALGAKLRCLANDGKTIEIELEGVRFVLSTTVAKNVTVGSIPDFEEYDAGLQRLTVLGQGEKAKVVGISPSCGGAERNRLLDLGIVPGTKIEAELVSIGKSAVAYRVRGALIAFRREQSEKILIKKE